MLFVQKRKIGIIICTDGICFSVEFQVGDLQEFKNDIGRYISVCTTG